MNNKNISPRNFGILLAVKWVGYPVVGLVLFLSLFSAPALMQSKAFINADRNDGSEQTKGVNLLNTILSEIQTVFHPKSADDYLPNSPTVNGKIAFVSNRSGNYEIYTINPDGTNLTNLTNTTSADEDSPSWSPNGTKIVYTKSGQIWTMKADGSSQTQVGSVSDADQIKWSPDGSKFVFTRSPNLWTINVDGSNLTQLTNDGFLPAWSPDGAKVVFSSQFNESGNFKEEIFVVNSDGSNRTRLINDNFSLDRFAAWSPDGTKILFVSNRDAGANPANWEVYTMNPAGGNIIRITNNSFQDTNPNWSPDGVKIVFSRKNPAGKFDIYTANANGTGETQLTSNSENNFSPAWQSLTPTFLGTIGGTVSASGTAVPNLTVTLTGTDIADSVTTTTDQSGQYTFPDLTGGGNYTVSVDPTVFMSPPQSITNLQYNQFPVDFTGSRVLYSISGTITRNTNPASGAPNVQIELRNTNTGQFTTRTTDANGDYNFTSTQAGYVYRLTPSLSGYAGITPVLRDTGYLNSNLSRQSFAATVATYTISGRVTSSGSALSGVSVNNTCAANAVQTDANGNYSFTGLAAGSNCVVTPALANHTFTPANQTFNNLSANQTADFTDAVSVYTISGNIQKNGANLQNVAVTLSGSLTTTITNAGGNYSFTVAAGGNYTVTPQLANNTFTPTSRTFNAVSSNQTANFTAQAVTFTISGNVKADGANLQGATVTKCLTGAQIAPLTTGANGNYSFTVPAGSKYDVSVYKAGFTFNPASQTFTNLQANQIANFQNGTLLCALASLNLQNWYRAENNANDTAGSDNGTLVNGTLYAPGKVGTAFSFDGVDDKVVIPNSPTVNMTGNQLTLTGWIKLSSSSSGYNQIFAMADGDAVTQRKFGLYVSLDRKLGFDIQTTAARVGGEFGTIPVDTWVHVAGTYNQSVMTWYINGQVVGTLGETGNIVSSASNLVIGQFATGGFSPFKGLIDEAQVYNRGLSASEIQTIYNVGSAGNCTNSTSSTTSGNGKIAFVKSSGNSQIYTLDKDGLNQTNISNNSANEGDPDWSPDGSKIVFWSTIDNSNGEIYTMNSDGGNRIRLTNNTTYERGPKWSPDGARIAFLDSRPSTEIYFMNADGTNQTRVTNNTGNELNLDWSSDGTKLVFAGDRAGSSYVIWVIDISGANERKLTASSSYEESATWSPDGSKIAFVGAPVAGRDIFIINPNGGSAINITNTPPPFDEWQSAWSSNGQKLAVLKYNTNNGNADIITMNPDGSGISNIVQNLQNVYPYGGLTWQPVLSSVINPTSNINIAFTSITQSGNTVVIPLMASQLPALPTGYILPANSPIYDIRTSAGYSGNITVSFNVPNVADAATCSNLISLHFENGAWTNNTNAAPTYNAGTQVCTVIAQTVTSLSPFVVALQSPTSFTYEADVQNRPSGDGFVDADDIQQIRSFVVGNGFPYQSNEFQRADCSPRSTLGDGFVDSDDVQQARRFSVGTDTNQLAGGPTSAMPPPVEFGQAEEAINSPFGKSTAPNFGSLSAGSAAFRVEDQTTNAGQKLVVRFALTRRAMKPVIRLVSVTMRRC